MQGGTPARSLGEAGCKTEQPEAISAATLSPALAKEAPFKSSLFEQDVSPTAWWKAGIMTGFPDSFSDLALRLAACEASRAALERQFSNMKHIYGDLRTALGIEKAGKLAFVYRRLNQLSRSLRNVYIVV